MYNMEFYEQLEQSRRHLFGNNGGPTPEDENYVLPPGIKVIPCRVNEHGEPIPDPHVSIATSAS